MRRKRSPHTPWRVAACIAAVGLVASACAAKTNAVGTSGSPVNGGTMVVELSSDPGSFNPAVSTSGIVRAAAAPIYLALTQLSSTFQAEPELATSWSSSDGGEVWTFQLRQGVEWSDGQPFSSADVVYSFNDVLLPYHPTTHADLAPITKSVTADGPDSVVFTFTQPVANLPGRVSYTEAPILPQHIYQGTNPLTAPANLHPVGTGPFELESYDPGSSITLVKNPHYFQSGLPHLDKLVYQIIPDPSTAYEAFESGSVDYLEDPEPQGVAALQKQKGVTVEHTAAISSGAVNCINTLVLNDQKTPLNNLQVRQALAYAINDKQIVNQAMFGQGLVGKGPVEASWAQDPNAPAYPFNASKAESLLTQAGYPPGPGGVRFSLTFPIGSGSVAFAQVVQQDLAAVGVTVNIQSLDGTTANNDVFVSHDFDLGFWGTCNGADPSVGFGPLYESSNVANIVGANASGYANPTLDSDLQQAASINDQAQRAKLYQQADDILLTNLPYIWLTYQDPSRAWRSTFHDLNYWTGNFAVNAYKS